MSGKAKWTLATGFAGSNGLRKVGQFANGHRLQDGMAKDPLPTLSVDLLAGWGYKALDAQLGRPRKKVEPEGKCTGIGAAPGSLRGRFESIIGGLGVFFQGDCSSGRWE